MIEIINKYWFPVVLISLWGVFFYLKIREKKKFRNEITGDFISNTPVTLVNPKFVKASTRMIAEDEKRERKLVARYSRGNASLQLGRFTTQEDKDELFEGITSYRFIEEPTDQYIDDVISNIHCVLAIHSGTVCGKVGYDDPWFVIQTNHGDFKCLIRKTDFILQKGDEKCVSRLDINDITQALTTIGVLKS